MEADGASLVHFRATAGVMLNRFEVYTGYDHLEIGSACLQGLLAGVRFWF